jgi:hypothetical protein
MHSVVAHVNVVLKGKIKLIRDVTQFLILVNL